MIEVAVHLQQSENKAGEGNSPHQLVRCNVNSAISLVYGRIPVNKQTKFADRDKGEKGVVELMDFIIARCRDRGVRKMERYSNTKLENALHLYRKYGFSEIPLPAHCVYDRTNVRMQLVL